MCNWFQFPPRPGCCNRNFDLPAYKRLYIRQYQARCLHPMQRRGQSHAQWWQGIRIHIISKRTLKTEQDLRAEVKGSKNLKTFEHIIQHLLNLTEYAEYAEKDDIFVFPALPEKKKIKLCDLCDLCERPIWNFAAEDAAKEGAVSTRQLCYLVLMLIFKPQDLGQWLCVPPFQMVCLLRVCRKLILDTIHPNEIEKENAFHGAGTDYQDS